MENRENLVLKNQKHTILYPYLSNFLTVTLPNNCLGILIDSKNIYLYVEIRDWALPISGSHFMEWKTLKCVFKYCNDWVVPNFK